MKMQFANLWEKVSDIVPDDPALINSKKIVTWKEYDSKAARIAKILEGHGLGSDSKVGLMILDRQLI